LLYGIEVLAVGGETLFANMHTAYDALSFADQKRYDALTVVHSWEQSHLKSGSRPPSDEENRAAPPISHPMVRTHLATGRKALYIVTHASHIEACRLRKAAPFLTTS
jgi:alpha-ketoglutarate-dependent taurine dioxygenase